MTDFIHPHRQMDPHCPADDDSDSIVDDADELVTTPMDPETLCLNPGREPAPKNPLCPVCEEQIRPISNDAERRFVCGCEQVWQFQFDRVDETDDTQ